MISGSPFMSDEIVFDIENINLGEGVSLELVVRNNSKEKESSEYIKSWANVSRGGAAACHMRSSSDDMTSLKGLKFEIVSARTVESRKHKKYVAYTVMVRVMDEMEDSHPAVLERRYNDFLTLYSILRKDFAIQLSAVPFPKKIIVGNFSPEVISSRCTGFEAFLDLIGSTTQMRCCEAVTSFFQERELIDALKLIQDKQYYQAIPLLENCFWVMNKLQTDRAPAVLRNLCLWMCVAGESGDPSAVGLAGLAVRRFQGVSDSDLLRYYVPLLSTAIELCRRHGKDGTPIVDHLESLIRRGIARPSTQPLLQMLLDDIINHETT